MGKKERHKQDLIALLDALLETDDAGRLTDYITANSNLPGRRGNLELAVAFADLIEDYAGGAPKKLWRLCTNLTAVPAEEAPVNDPRELLPFCGALGIGALGSISPAFFEGSLTHLQALANDPRWRMREAVGMGLQRLLTRRGHDTLTALTEWLVDENWLEMRAAAAGVAEPALLGNKETALAALQLHRTIIDRVLATQACKSEGFKVLRKALGYTLSVVIQAVPEQGFAFMRQLVETQDPDVLWIVRQNLKKSRLVKNFPEQVEAIKHNTLAQGKKA